MSRVEHVHAACTGSALALTAACAVAAEDQFWPELDGFFRLNDRARVFLVASATRAEDTDERNGSPRFEDGTFGAHLDVSFDPLLREGLRQQDWKKERFLWARVGYNYVGNYRADGDRYHEDRGVIELSMNQPLARGLGFTGRLRWDARDVDGAYSNRYRVRAGLERPMTYREHDLNPYARVEVSYDTRYDTWNRQRYQAGVEMTLNDRWRVEPYLARQDDSRSATGHVNALGLILKYYH